MKQFFVKYFGLHGDAGLVLLWDKKKIHVPIFIGPDEIRGILMFMEHVQTPRPMTYDIFTNVIKALGGTIEKVEIPRMNGSTYIGTIYIMSSHSSLQHGTTTIDSRPSDAINLALRFNAPIFISDEVVDAAKDNGDKFNRQIEGEKKECESCSDFATCMDPAAISLRLERTAH